MAWACACALWVGAGAGDARAQPATPSAQTAPSERPWANGVSEHEQAAALDLYLAGNGEFAESRFVQAIAKYREALRHWDHPAIRFNLAVSLISVDQPVDARYEVERSLAFGAAPLGGAAYNQAIAYRKLLDAQLVHLKIACNVPGAKVTLDGKWLFTGQGEHEEIVLPGEHQVVSTEPGYTTLTETLTLVAGQPQSYGIQLQQEAALEPVAKPPPCTTSPNFTPPQPSSITPKGPRLSGSRSALTRPSPPVTNSTPTTASWIPAGTRAPTPATAAVARTRPTTTVLRYDEPTVTTAAVQAAPMASEPIVAPSPITPPSAAPALPSPMPVVPSYDTATSYLAPTMPTSNVTIYEPPVMMSYNNYYVVPAFPSWFPPSPSRRTYDPQASGRPGQPGQPVPGQPQPPTPGLPMPPVYPPVPAIPTLPPAPMNTLAIGVRSAPARAGTAANMPATVSRSPSVKLRAPAPSKSASSHSASSGHNASSPSSSSHSARSSSHNFSSHSFSSGRR